MSRAPERWPRLPRYERVMSAPIIVSQLGQVRESARAAAREEGTTRTTRSRPLMTVSSLLLAAVAVAGGVAAPLVDENGDLATQVVRAVVVVAFAAAGLIALARRPGEKQPLLVLLFAALGGLVTVSASVVDAHAHGAVVGSTALSLAHFVEPVALALLPVAAMHVLLGIPDGSCGFSRVAIAGGYVVGLALGLVLWAQRPGLPLWPVVVEAVVAVLIGAGASQRRYAHSRARTPAHAVVRLGGRCGPGDAAGGAGPAGPRRLARSSLPGRSRPPSFRSRWPSPWAVRAVCRPHRPDPGPHRVAGRADRRRRRRLPGHRGRPREHADPFGADLCWSCRWSPPPWPPCCTARPAKAVPLRQPHRLRRARGARRRAAHFRQPAVARRPHGRAAPAGGRVAAQDPGAHVGRGVDRVRRPPGADGVGPRRPGRQPDADPRRGVGGGPGRRDGHRLAQVWAPGVVAGRETCVVRVAPTTHSGRCWA